MILVKHLKFLYLHFSRPNWSKKVFGNVLDRKWAFQTKTTLILEGCKICIFYRGVSSYFWSKLWSFLSLFFLVLIDQKECLATFFILKSCFYPTNKLIIGSWKICIFSKGVSTWFWSKIWSFFTFLFLGQIDQKECLVMFLIEHDLF